MSALATLMATAAVSLGVVAAVKAVRRRARGARVGAQRVNDGTVIELEPDQGSGIWRDPKSTEVAD